MSQQKRAHFRIIYPLKTTARFLSRKGEHLVLDISERGLKFSVSPESVLGHEWKAGEILVGQIIFLCGDRVKIEGKILRTAEAHVVLQLIEPIPLKTMYDEHRLIINQFDKAD